MDEGLINFECGGDCGRQQPEIFDLGLEVGRSFRHLMESGKLQEMVDRQVAKTCEEAVSEALRSYSEFGQSLKKGLVGALGVNIDDLGLTGYNLTVLGIIRKRLEAALDKVGVEKLKTDLEHLLAAHAPEKMLLSELVREFKTWAREHGGCNGTCTVNVKQNEYGHWWVTLDHRARVSEYECEFRFLLGNNKEGDRISVIRIEGQDPSKGVFCGVLNGFPRAMFHLYAAGTKLVVDEEYFDTDVRSEE
jgi:hypothetical protein